MVLVEGWGSGGVSGKNSERFAQVQKKKEIEKKTQPGWEALPIRSMNGLLTRMMRNDG